MKETSLTDKQIADILNDPEKMTQVLKKAVNSALLMHKRAGNPVCGMKEGKLVWIPSDEIPLA